MPTNNALTNSERANSAKWWRTLAPGETRKAFWEVEGVVPGVLSLPVFAACGGESGPTILLTAGVHGDEYEGPAALAALFDDLPVANLRGTIIALPVLNGAAWQARSRISPADGVDMNRIFTLGKDGTTDTERIAELVFYTFIADRERGCDILVDLHSGGAALFHLPLMGWYDGATDAENCARRFDAAFRPWVIPDVPGVLSYEAHRLGKIALGAEWGGGGLLDLPGVAAYRRGLRNALENQGILPLLPDEPAPEPDNRAPITGDYQSAAQGGLFFPRVRLGDTVAAGEVMGTLRDALGNVAEEVRAARAGVVAGLAARPLLRPGERVAYVG